VEQIRKGMVVHSSDGERLGKVVAVRADTIVVEKGFFFPTDYTCRRTDISDVRGEDVILRRSKAQLEGGVSGQGTETSASPSRQAATAGAGAGATQEVRVPVAEEQLDVQKRARKAGEVRVSKHVTTEEKQVMVPVTREEVHVERVPAGRDAGDGEARFAQENVSVPVMEEEVVVSKRPVVREEVRIRTESRQEQRPVSAQVRREEVEIEEDKDGDGRSRPLPEDPDASHP
jgi:uncharacterized protein (TIGR02271 family)